MRSFGSSSKHGFERDADGKVHQRATVCLFVCVAWKSCRARRPRSTDAQQTQTHRRTHTGAEPLQVLKVVKTLQPPGGTSSLFMGHDTTSTAPLREIKHLPHTHSSVFGAGGDPQPDPAHSRRAATTNVRAGACLASQVICNTVFVQIRSLEAR